MPPSFLLLPQQQQQQQQSTFPQIIDLKGGTTLELLQKLEELLPCENTRGETAIETVHLVSPPIRLGRRGNQITRIISHDDCRLSGGKHKKRGGKWNCRPISERIPNLTTEDMPFWSPSYSDFVSNLSLTIYEVTCA
eukprot:CAMPEP_0202454314 /NCGR_PEP_ID=MMETSP1360-20130828/12086_1 /ASSEMBLY_ACC=CAM_ASM_000848 /TAXON_ID=515479 /ORGANISM="Licmophora paradoxa, Strain CCMP2313" /LENGTH=136 /DNA_ID=CAMNT_0049073609 /DNA_START=324 /DNA_END=730 /DNA_ORIENTATION=+